MHKFLRAIGFSKMDRKSCDALIDNISEHPQLVYTAADPDGNNFAELRRSFAPGMNIVVRGIYDENDVFHRDYYFPCFEGNDISTTEMVEIEKYAEKESYAGICDDMRLGITLIFYLQNVVDLYTYRLDNVQKKYVRGAALSALSTEGKILLPMDDRIKAKKTVDNYAEQSKNAEQSVDEREESILKMTMDDFEIYGDVFKRVQTEDILSIVNTSFMPFGVESDQYSIVGEILGYEKVTNYISGEKIYCLKLLCSGLHFEVCINEADLMGVPEIGRRFKGNIWMQGNACFDTRSFPDMPGQI